MMRTYKTEAIVIKRRNVGEADRLLTVFTRDHGKVSVKATGIRRVPSRRSAHVELLNHAVLTLYAGKRYPTLTEATSLETFSDLKDDLQKVGFAYHICELIDGLCPENQEHRQVYFLLKNTLERLSIRHSGERSDSRIITDAGQASMTSVESLVEVIHDFEIQLLTLLGYWHRPLAASTLLDTTSFIENILERRLKSKNVFSKIF